MGSPKDSVGTSMRSADGVEAITQSYHAYAAVAQCCGRTRQRGNFCEVAEVIGNQKVGFACKCGLQNHIVVWIGL